MNGNPENMNTMTLFTAPKPFLDSHISVIQKNAIRSWTNLGEEVDVVIVGEEPGLTEAIADLPVIHKPEVQRNAHGTPLISSIFSQARAAGSGEILCYLNADIILLPAFLDVVQGIIGLKDQFLLVGRRCELEILEEFNFEQDWVGDLEQRLNSGGKISGLTAMDYFIFPRDLYLEIPDFAVGRAGWDNWMIYQAFQKGWQIIDITPSVRVIHQRHDYHHLPGGKSHHKLDESDENVALSGGMNTLYDLLDVKYEYKNGNVTRKVISIAYILRRFERFVIPEKQAGWRWQLTRVIRKLRRRISRPGG
jgi:hypothetical protein